MNSSDSSEEENLTSSMISLTNDIDSNTINEDENNLLNNYKYSEITQENIDITINNFMKLTEEKQDVIIYINNVKNDLSLLPEFMKYIKLCDYKLALNLMDNPGYCFENIFEKLFNKSENIEDHMNSINILLEIFPDYSKEYLFDILKSHNYILDNVINSLFL
tara:strand:- start:5638 stop:6126 length:489 start_codon:yes stop_codon:yes gene_type:complete